VLYDEVYFERSREVECAVRFGVHQHVITFHLIDSDEPFLDFLERSFPAAADIVQDNRRLIEPTFCYRIQQSAAIGKVRIERGVSDAEILSDIEKGYLVETLLTHPAQTWFDDLHSQFHYGNSNRGPWPP